MTNMIIRKKNNVLGLLVVTFGVLIFLGNGDAVNIKGEKINWIVLEI